MPESDRIEQIRKSASNREGEDVSLTGAERIAAMRNASSVSGRLATFSDDSQDIGRIVLENTTVSFPESAQSKETAASQEEDNE